MLQSRSINLRTQTQNTCTNKGKPVATYGSTVLPRRLISIEYLFLLHQLVAVYNTYVRAEENRFNLHWTHEIVVKFCAYPGFVCTFSNCLFICKRTIGCKLYVSTGSTDWLFLFGDSLLENSSDRFNSSHVVFNVRSEVSRHVFNLIPDCFLLICKSVTHVPTLSPKIWKTHISMNWKQQSVC